MIEAPFHTKTLLFELQKGITESKRNELTEEINTISSEIPHIRIYKTFIRGVIENPYSFELFDSCADFSTLPHPRKKIFELVGSIISIFAVSFIPKNPSKQQFTHFQQVLVPCDDLNQNDEFSQPSPVFSGMLKPYPTFSSQFQPDEELDKLSWNYLIGENQVPTFDEIQAPQMRKTLHTIVRLFVHDTEAATMALTYFQIDHPVEQIRKIVFSKLRINPVFQPVAASLQSNRDLHA